MQILENAKNIFINNLKENQLDDYVDQILSIAKPSIRIFSDKDSFYLNKAPIGSSKFGDNPDVDINTFEWPTYEDKPLSFLPPVCKCCW